MPTARDPLDLRAGDRAPEIALEGTSGETSLAALRGPEPGRYVVLYFYPRDKTPGCTREGQAFSAATRAFEKAGAIVVGISKDSLTSHRSFAASCAITVPLLADPDLVAHRAYGAHGEKVMYGKKVLGTIRSTFVVAPDGTLAGAFRNVKVDGHAEAVLATITAHRKSAPPVAARASAPKATTARSSKTSAR